MNVVVSWLLIAGIWLGALWTFRQGYLRRGYERVGHVTERGRVAGLIVTALLFLGTMFLVILPIVHGESVAPGQLFRVLAQRLGGALLLLAGFYWTWRIPRREDEAGQACSEGHSAPSA